MAYGGLMLAARVVVVNTDAGGQETAEWFYGQRLTAFVERLIPMCKQAVEAAVSSDLIPDVRDDICDVLNESIVVRGVQVFTQGGTEILTKLGFGRYVAERKIVMLDACCDGHDAPLAYRLCHSTFSAERWNGYLVFALTAPRVGLLVQGNDGKRVAELSPAEIAELGNML